MSLKKKIISGFLISAVVIGSLSVYEYLNFIEIKKEIRNLEFTDTIRSKSLQLRRHEKNFFLFASEERQEELRAIYRYLDEIQTLLETDKITDSSKTLSALIDSLREYRKDMDRIKKDSDEIPPLLRTGCRGCERIYPLIETAFLEQPLGVVSFLEKGGYASSDTVIARLRTLHSEIQGLRRYGENIITLSKELDRAARERVERVIYISQMAIIVFFPLFILTGFILLFIITGSVVKRLRHLTEVVERAGRGDFMKLDTGEPADEVGVLIKKFDEMEEKILKRDEELKIKNEELLQSKKLAALGTLASGVAHELNNPLNNIYISAQVLKREGEKLPVFIQETIDDIMSQSIRVKHIVADLLEFARGKEPQMREIDLGEIIMGAYKLVSTTRNTENINFVFHKYPEEIKIFADPEQIERVFINLFNNAIDAMDGKGELKVLLERDDEKVIIKVSDTGKGIPPEMRDKVFEPFYTTKDRGTGLGLAIVYNIVRKHNGDITVESEEGRGTTFTITLDPNPVINLLSY
ncbi:MAG: hypothetical protein OHK0032_13930 [Thermodesulfovibrionales bacterium]